MAKTPRSTLGAGKAPAPQFPGLRSPTSDFQAVRDRLQTRPLYHDIDLSTARSIAAGTAIVLPIQGNSFFADQAPNSGYCTVHCQDEASAGNTPITLFPGAVFHVPFTFLVIENVSQPGLSLRIIYGVDIDFTPALSAGLFGAVNVVEGGKIRTLGGYAFMATSNQQAVAAQFSHAQLWNLPASGKNLIVNKVIMSQSGGAAGFALSLRRNTAALANLLGNPPSKLLGGAASAAAESRFEANAVLQGTAMANIFVNATDAYVHVPLVEPIIIPPGEGLLGATGVVNVSIHTQFDFWEEDV